MENTPTIHFHKTHVNSIGTVINGNNWHVGRKNSDNEKTSYDSSVHFLPSKRKMPLGRTPELSSEIHN
jgi:hypothetical protein